MKKVNFFISCTFEDLKEHRRILLNAFSSLKQEVEAMEYWSPDSQSSLELCLDHVRSSDIYIGILGTRYGFEPDNKKSITQYEYEEAVRLNLKRLVYFIDEENHKIVYKDVDVGEKAQKLKTFKQSIENSIVRGKFSSPEDLSSKVITHCIQVLDKIGSNIKMLKDSNKIFSFSTKGAYDISATELSFDISKYLKLDNNGKTTLDNVFLQRVLMGGIIVNQLYDEDYSCLNGITTFDHVTKNVISCLMNDKKFNVNKLIEIINSEVDPFKMRLLISLSGGIRDLNLLDSICNKILCNSGVDSYFINNKFPVSTLYETGKRSISAIASPESKPIIQSYILKATKRKNWKAKKLFESVFNFIDR
jgi:hypothetical protein